MSIWEIVIIGVALSMDAFAVGMTDGMTEPRMPLVKCFVIAGAFGFFQCVMPLAGYHFGAVFSGWVQAVAPWLSFALLGVIGGKMIFDCARELSANKRGHAALRKRERGLGAGKLILQAVATSIDALAVGIALLAAETTRGLPAAAEWCAFLIGAITFSLSSVAVLAGRKTGSLLADRAELLGGTVLVIVGVKILAEGLL